MKGGDFKARKEEERQKRRRRPATLFVSFCHGAGGERQRLGGGYKKNRPFCVCVLNFKDGLISNCDPDSNRSPAIGGGREAGRYRGKDWRWREATRERRSGMRGDGGDVTESWERVISSGSSGEGGEQGLSGRSFSWLICDRRDFCVPCLELLL